MATAIPDMKELLRGYNLGPKFEQEVLEALEDARRWRGLMASGTMSFMGSAECKPDAKEYAHIKKVEIGPHPHFCMNFWGTPQLDRIDYNGDFCRLLLTTYAETMADRKAL